MLFNFYIYNRRGKCLYYKEWNRPLNTLSDDAAEEKRLMYCTKKKSHRPITVLLIFMNPIMSSLANQVWNALLFKGRVLEIVTDSWNRWITYCKDQYLYAASF